MRRAIKKPVEIEYMTFEELWDIKQTHDNNIKDIPNIDYASIRIYWEPEKSLHIKTLNGYVKMIEDDYLIIGVKGELYPCKIDIFNETYTIMEEK